MTDLLRHRVRWTGLPSSPGVSNFYFTAPAMNNILHTWLATMAAMIPSGVVLKFDTQAAIIDSLTGDITGMNSGSVAADIVCSGAGNYSAAAGAMVNWHTNEFVDSREVQGRTFLVPFSSLDNSGTILNTSLTSMKTAVDAFLTSATGDFVIWKRPKQVKNSQGEVVSTTPGSVHPVVTATIQDKSFVLRSRRD
jgi:hypothetical protein